MKQGMIILGVFKISGHSMMPTLKPGTRVVVSSIPYLFSKPKIGDIVLFKYRDKIMVKRIKKFENRKIIVAGDNSSDSLKTEPIERRDILGKVLLTIHY